MNMRQSKQLEALTEMFVAEIIKDTSHCIDVWNWTFPAGEEQYEAKRALLRMIGIALTELD